jgi:DNA-3-methyladenine glycosylase I
MKVPALVSISPGFSLLSRRFLFLSTSMAPSSVKSSLCETVGTKRRTTSKSSVASSSPKKQKSTNVEATSSLGNDDGEKPWYHFFTKGDAEYNTYMASEWGFELRSDVKLFEKISLEGAQSGLSWLTILRKRQAYRRTFHGFDPVKVATMTEDDVNRILAEQPDDTRDVVVRHKGKIESVINNAQCILKMRAEEENATDAEHGVFDKFIWSFVNDQPIVNRIGSVKDAPTRSVESEAMSKALKKRGFKFVGPTTCYAMMQAAGMVLDHPKDSPEWQQAYQRLQNRPGGFQHGTNLDTHAS